MFNEQVSFSKKKKKNSRKLELEENLIPWGLALEIKRDNGAEQIYPCQFCC